MKIIEMCEGERPRERMLSKGPGAMGNSELIAIILRSGSKDESALDLARKLLASADGSLSALSRMSVNAMCRIKGIGRCKSLQISAALELGRRFMLERSEGNKTSLTSAEDRKSVV